MPFQEQLQELLASLWQLFLILLNPIYLIPAIIIVCIFIKKNKDYKKSAYYQITKQPYSSVKHNTGSYGEYLTYKCLKNFEDSGAKFLFNVYIPKENGETTEIDVLMICSKGIFVFESKNYSGWIFGDENKEYWYQTLPAGRGRSHKERFYNPIMQNNSHIKHLRALLSEQMPMRSIIVFSNRCTLKSIQLRNGDVRVINRYNVASVVSEICNCTPNDLLNESNINDIYNKLYAYTRIDATAKVQHIINIYDNLKPQSANQTVAPVVRNSTDELAIPQTTNKPQTEDIQFAFDDNVKMQVDFAQNKSAEFKEIETEFTEEQSFKCPNCGGNLIIRTASRGLNVGKQFYGCSNYPKCKYIRNIE